MANSTFTHSLQGKNSVLTWFRTAVSFDNSETRYSEPQPKIYMTVEKEMLLWKKIDGECTPEEERLVDDLLENNPEFRAEYESMLEMHHGFKQLLGKKRERRIGDREKK